MADEFERTLDAILGTGAATSQEPWADIELLGATPHHR
jgi:hypothetical protein